MILIVDAAIPLTPRCSTSCRCRPLDHPAKPDNRPIFPLRLWSVLLGFVVAAPVLAQVPVSPPAVPSTTATAFPETTPLMWVELRPPGAGLLDKLSTQGELLQLLKAEIAKAQAAGRTPFVEIGAAWCGGCVTLENEIHRKDREMLVAFAGAYVIHLDYDDWNLGSLLTGSTIPAIVAINHDGKAVGQLIGVIEATPIQRFIQAHRWSSSTSMAIPIASGPVLMPGIPNRPDLVTVVPFYWKPHETGEEQTRVVFPAEVSGHQGILLLDLGDPDLDLNRTFLRPSATGGLDTVRETDTTDEHRLADWPGQDSAHVTLRIGTFKIDFVDPTQSSDPRHINAFLNHQFGNYAQVFPPRLGNIGPVALEQFETVIDYTHRRLVLIRLDSVGRRLIPVSAYTPQWSAPLVDIPIGKGKPWWGVQANLGGEQTTVFFDTGSASNYLTSATAERMSAHIVDGTLDSLVIAGRSFGPIVLRSDVIPPLDLLGFPFLSRLGAVGFNHRTQQFLLYK
jgi:hypothetical protein